MLTLMKCFAQSLKFVAVGAFSFGAMLAQAGLGLTADTATLSALHDTSNLYGSQSTYNAHGFHSGGDGDLYINDMQIVGGAGWDANIGMSASSVFRSWDSTANNWVNHNLGDVITGDTDLDFGGIAQRSGAVDPAVSLGMYDFSVQILGGSTANSMDLVDQLNLHIEVAERLDFTTHATFSPDPLAQGGAGTVSVNLQNDMANRNLKTTTWWISGFGDGATHYLGFSGFAGDWFNYDLAPGGSVTDLHSNWNAASDQALGTYTSNTGVIGGLYQGDWHWMAANTSVRVVATPEPATFAVLGLGVLALRRRRK